MKARRTLVHRGVTAAIAGAIVMAAAPAVASAGTIAVTTNDDVVAVDGYCSLREAIQAANTNSAFDDCVAGTAAPDTISVPSDSTYQRAIGPSAEGDTNLTGDYDLDTAGGDVTIAGAGTSAVAIAGGSGQTADRIFDVLGTGTVTISGVQLSGGLPDGPGGSVRASGATVNLEQVRAINGSATYNGPGDSPVLGGGQISMNGGTLHVARSSLESAHVNHGATGDDNQTMVGGAILLAGGAGGTVDRTTISSSTTGTQNSTMTIGGNAIAVVGAGADVSITNSTLSSNSSGSGANGGAAQRGGAVYWDDNNGANNTLTIQNSTISGNTLPLAGAEGGAIYANDGNVKVVNSTIADSTAATGKAIAYHAGDGTFDIRGTILDTGTADGQCAGDPLASGGYNIEAGGVSDCGLAGAGDTMGNAQLAALADNGGLTKTRVAANAALIDAIPSGSCTDAAGDPLTSDQRGSTRAGSCDIGALELGCDGKAATIVGTIGPDVLGGGPDDDVIVGLGGGDTISGGGGNDTICGNDGDDTLTGDAGDDDLAPGTGGGSSDGGADNDTVSYFDVTTSVTVTLPGTGASGQSLAGIENITGGRSTDTLNGDGGNNVIDGSNDSAVDTISGGEGDDTIKGSGTAARDKVTFIASGNPMEIDLTGGPTTGQGTDTLTGISDVVGSAGNDTIIGNELNNAVNGGNGNNDSDTFSDAAVPANDSHTGVTGWIGGFNAIKGPGAGSDSMTGVENFIGTPNDDTIAPSTQVNDFDGGDGFDKVDSSETGGNSVTYDLPAGTMTSAQGGNDTIHNFEGALGSLGGDTFIGTAGPNYFDPNAGDDTYTGNGGDDTVAYLERAEAVDIDLTAQTEEGQGDDTFTGVSNAIGSSENDTIQGSPGDNRIDGAGGDMDQISFASATSPMTVDLGAGTSTGTGNDTFANVEDVVGSPQADTITGNSSANTIDGGGGDDLIDGGPGGSRDTLTGGPGNNTVSFASSGEPIRIDLGLGSVQGQGDDLLSGFANAVGSSGDDTFQGSAGNNAMNGGPGTDVISYAGSTSPVSVNLAAHAATGAGSDVLAGFEDVLGSAGNDTLQGDGGSNELDGGPGSDTASYAGAPAVNASLVTKSATGDGSDTFFSIENLAGSSGSDTLTGNGADNSLAGGDGADTISGGSGTDRVSGGAGADNLQIRDGHLDVADCGADSDPDSVTADVAGIDTLTSCTGPGDALHFIGSEQVTPPPSGGKIPPPGGGQNNPPAARKCPRGKIHKHGRCIKKKKPRRHKRRGRRSRT